MHNEADTVAEHEYLNNQEFFLHQNEHSLKATFRLKMEKYNLLFGMSSRGQTHTNYSAEA